MSKGLGKYSKAPPWKAETALSRSEWAVMMITGRAGKRCFSCCSSSSPDSPGMRISLTHDLWRRRVPAAESASWAEAKLLNSMPARVSVFSNTQRMERSSSIIQIGFMGLLVISEMEFGFSYRQQYCKAGIGPACCRIRWSHDAERQKSGPASVPGRCRLRDRKPEDRIFSRECFPGCPARCR